MTAYRGPRTLANVRPTNDIARGRSGRYAPDIPEDDPPPLMAPAVVLTVDDVARQLAADPEFRAWQEEEHAAEVAVLMRRAMR